MKKIIKNNLFGFILGGIIFGSIVYAASYLATDISYIPTDVSWEVRNVNDALDSLYDMTKESNSNKGQIKKILLGTTSGTYDLTSYDNYQNFTIDNFTLELVSAHGSIWYSGRDDSGTVGSGSLTFTKTYDSATGKLTISQSGNTTLYVTAHGETNADATYSASFNIYLLYVE